MEIIFYTRKKCELCQDAKLLLEILQNEYDFAIIERDIDENDEWTEKYGLMIPVIEYNGEVIQYGQIDLLEMENFLKTLLQ